MTDHDGEQEELRQKFRDGDHDAFRRLTQPHVPALEARARRWVGQRLQKQISVADIVQDARLIAFQRRREFEFRAPDALRRWLLAIVDNRARKAVGRVAGTARRDVARELTRGARPATVELPGHADSPSRVAIARELAALTDRAREGLGAHESEIVRLAHDDGLSLREVAARLQRPYEAIKKAHARALVRLGQSLRQLRRNDHDPNSRGLTHPRGVDRSTCGERRT